MSKIVTAQELMDCKVDADTFGEAANGAPGVKVKARLGRVYWTLATYDRRFNDRAVLFDKMYVEYDNLLNLKVIEFDDSRNAQVRKYDNTLATKIKEFDDARNNQVTKYDKTMDEKVVEYDLKIDSVDAEIKDAKSTADAAKKTADQALEQTKLNPATAEDLGVVKIGKGLKVTEDGELSVSSSGLPIGTLVHHQGKRSSLPVGQLPYDGYTYKRADFPELWDLIKSGHFLTVTDATWLANPKYRGCFTEGNGSTTFRLPDLNGVQPGSIPDLFLRGSKSDQVVGDVLDDAMRQFSGQFWTLGDPDVMPSGVFSGEDAGNLYAGDGTTRRVRRTITFDNSGTTLTAEENRPKATYIIYAIVAKANFVEEPPEGVKPMVTVGGNNVSGAQNVTGPISATGNITTQGDLNGNIKHLLNAQGAAPIQACRAWVAFNGITGTILAAANVKSVVKNSTGDYTINFMTAMPTVNYATTFGISGASGDTIYPRLLANRTLEQPLLKTTSSVRISTAGYDTPYISMGVFC